MVETTNCNIADKVEYQSNARERTETNEAYRSVNVRQPEYRHVDAVYHHPTSVHVLEGNVFRNTNVVVRKRCTRHLNDDHGQ